MLRTSLSRLPQSLPRSGVRSLGLLCLASVVLSARPAHAQLDYTKPPIDYLEATPRDAVSALQARLDSGDANLRFDRHFGYLRSLLKQLEVPLASQTLVFSKTSLQVKHISPRTPRAIYFSDDVYVGWVQGGNIEVSTVDPQLGANFYLLEQQETARPKIVRQTYDCLQCHSSGLTRDVPGHLVRSVATGPDGHIRLSAPSYLSDHNSPLRERWGGWYVTGQHGAQRHLGNRFAKPTEDPQRLDLEPGANVTDLERWFETAGHLSEHSDIVALLVLEHQTNMHNRLARANFLWKIAAHEKQLTDRSLQEIAAPVVEHLLFSGEAPLTDAIVGTSGFSEQFPRRGPRDEQGRSLRDFDLRRRLFTYPCSYLIYSDAFDQLPAPVKREVYRQLWEALTGTKVAPAFAHLTAGDRQAIVQILRATKLDLPDYWLSAIPPASFPPPQEPTP